MEDITLYHKEMVADMKRALLDAMKQGGSHIKMQEAERIFTFLDTLSLDGVAAIMAMGFTQTVACVPDASKAIMLSLIVHTGEDN